MKNHNALLAFVKCATCIVLVFFSTLTKAKPEKIYLVEVVIFENLNSKALHETWPLNPGSPNIYKAKTLHTLALEQQNKEGNTQGFIELEPNAFQLNDAEKRIQQQGNYRIIAHKAWRQPIQSKEKAENIRFYGGRFYRTHLSNEALSDDPQNATSQSSDLPSYEIDGVLKLSKSRYLHLKADLSFTKPMRVLTSISGPNQAVSLAQVNNTQHWENEPNARLQPFRLNQSVRIRMNEVHYVDHPMFGMLITVLPED